MSYLRTTELTWRRGTVFSCISCRNSPRFRHGSRFSRLPCRISLRFRHGSRFSRLPCRISLHFRHGSRVFALRDRRLSGWSGVQTAESLPSRQKTAYAAELGLLVASRLTASDSPRIGTGGFLPFRLPSGRGAAKASFVYAPAIRHRLSTVNHPGPPGHPPEEDNVGQVPLSHSVTAPLDRGAVWLKETRP